MMIATAGGIRGAVTLIAIANMAPAATTATTIETGIDTETEIESGIEIDGCRIESVTVGSRGGKVAEEIGKETYRR